MRARAWSSEKPRIGSPLLTPRAERSKGSGVLARPSMTMSLTRRPDAAVAVPSRSRRLDSVLLLLTAWTAAISNSTMAEAAPSIAAGRSSRTLPAQQQAPRRGTVVDRVAGRAAHARHAAFSTIQAQSCAKLIPQ